MNFLFKSIFLSLSISILTFIPPLSAVEPLTDHQLVKPYEGSQLRRKNIEEFNEYSAFTGMDELGEQPTGIKLEGKVTKLVYSQPKGRSLLEVAKNYQLALKQAGGEILYQCNQRKYECAKRFAAKTLQTYSDINSLSDLVGHYTLAKVKNKNQTAYIAIAIGQQVTDIHIIELVEMDAGLVSLNASALSDGLDEKGFVTLEGIYFDSNKATIQEKSNETFVQVAKLLTERPSL